MRHRLPYKHSHAFKCAIIPSDKVWSSADIWPRFNKASTNLGIVARIKHLQRKRIVYDEENQSINITTENKVYKFNWDKWSSLVFEDGKNYDPLLLEKLI